MKFREIKVDVKDAIKEALRSLDYPLVEFNVDEAPAEFGDLYTNVAFLLSKMIKRKPSEIADEIVKKITLQKEIRVYAHKSGYINFVIDALSFVNSILKEEYKIDMKEKRVVIEHTSVNPNKALHMGHVRNLVIGDSLYRLLKFTNHKVYVLNYIDDSGLQVADIIVGFYFIKMPLESNKKFDHYCGDDVYVYVNKLYKDDPSLLEKRRIVLQSMEEYNSDIANFAREITNKVLREQLKTCWRLNARYDYLNFESQIIASKLWMKIREMLIAKGIAVIDDDKDSKYYKCLVIKAGIEGEEKVLERSDGTATYIAKDIPYAAWKLGLIDNPFSYKEYEKQFDGSILYSTIINGNRSLFDVDEAITVIDVRQSRLQKIITKVLEELGNKKVYTHPAYEVVALSSNTAKELGIDTKDKRFIHMKGREGTYINADIMIDKLHVKAYEEAKKENDNIRTLYLSEMVYCLLELKKYDQAEKLCKEEIRYSKETGNHQNAYMAMTSLSLVYALAEKWKKLAAS
ncbi:MAG: arginine--tRNA ligase [Candidatus Nitrosocaldaceae archaeon]